MKTSLTIKFEPEKDNEKDVMKLFDLIILKRNIEAGGQTDNYSIVQQLDGTVDYTFEFPQIDLTSDDVNKMIEKIVKGIV